jgi:hypothetical protein
MNKLIQLDEDELLLSLDEYMNILNQDKQIDPVTASEIFIAESLKHAATTSSNDIDPSKLRRVPKRFFKPVKSSLLNKILSQDADYFNH